MPQMNSRQANRIARLVVKLVRKIVNTQNKK
ncbi:Uncharacterised protein [Staphylococcus piscifermentans]|nr:Uncharacterised protein [Staphylococcus piscifermentans]